MTKEELQTTTAKYVIKDGMVTLNGEPVESIAVKAMQVKTQDGNTFVAYKGITSSKRYVDLSFTRAVEDIPVLPKLPSFYIFIIPEGSMIVDKNRMYPRIYLRGLLDVIEYSKDYAPTLKV